MRNTTNLLLATTVAAFLPAQNQAFQFTTGIDGAIEVPYDPAMLPPTGITIEAWITYDDATIPTGLFYWPTIARQNIQPQLESWNFRVGASNTGNRSLEFIMRGPTGGLNVLNYLFAPGEFAQFTHLAATYDGQTMTLYKNGVQIATRTLPTGGDIPNNGGILRIGNGDASFPGVETWNGLIDELRIWPMPRSAAEITESMNQTLMSMPGKVITFNADGVYADSSRGLLGTPVGTTGFAAGAPGLNMMMPNALNLGTSTTTCARTIDTALGGAPTVGNSSFTVWCTKGPLPASSALGIVVAAGQAAPTGQPPFAGVQLAFSLASVLSTSAFVPGTTGRGLQRIMLPIPNSPVYLGTGFVFQFGFADGQCGPLGFTGSDGVAFTIQ
ncbi:MAG: LamG domain-containing protein [Planctomycetes bacterium]|nr:LamG domain-containing protein [Planctomycetota bacterium]